jgi:hypothetical protein
MQGSFKFWKVLDKRRLLLALMEELAGGAHVSFEGDLRGLTLSNIPGASGQPTTALRRSTVWPKQDFAIVPLEPSMERKIIAAIGGTVPAAIIHIQIEKDGQLQFGAYDNFHQECIYFGNAVKEAVIQSLVSQNIMRPYIERRPSREIKS